MLDIAHAQSQKDIGRKVRSLRKKSNRGSLTEEEYQYLSTHQDAIDQWVRDRFFSYSKDARALIAQMMNMLDFQQGIASLGSVSVDVRPCHNPGEVTSQIAVISSQEAVAFDLARNAQTVLSLLENMIPLWESWWHKESFAATKEEAEDELHLAIDGELEARALCKAFLSCWDTTQKQLGKRYAELSRMFTVEGGVWSGGANTGWAR